MTSKVTTEKTEIKHFRLLRKTAIITALAGAATSLGLMLYLGRHNESIILIGLFAIWVSSPFMALLLASVVSKRWSELTRVTLYCLMLFLAVGSLIIYVEVALNPPAKLAFPFLVVPLGSWLLMAFTLPIAASMARRAAQRKQF